MTTIYYEGDYMKLGLDRFLKEFYKQFQGQRIGLVTNMTGVGENLIPSIDSFHMHSGINLVALYAPEHGIRGDAKEGESVESSVDPHTKLPVYSLYGKSKKPSKEMLDAVDVVIFDLQDIGSRYYTFIYTLANLMEACEAYGKHVVVLDRPNPISGESIEGNLVEKSVRSFVGLLPIPNRHAMTIGELASLYKYEFGYRCELTIVPMEGWFRKNYFDETNLLWVPPSPNAPTIDMAVLYPGTCLIEGTNISEGRGTTKPFECAGAPFIDGYQLAKAFNEKEIPGILARPTSFIPSAQKHMEKICGGVQLHVLDRNELNSLEAGLTLLETIFAMYPDNVKFLQHKNGKYFFDLLAGTKDLRQHILRGSVKSFKDICAEQSDQFKRLSEQYYLYN